MSIGSRLAELRKSRGWTQSRLAQESHLSASTIAMYETNRRSPDAIAVSKLATALEVPNSTFAELSVRVTETPVPNKTQQTQPRISQQVGSDLQASPGTKKQPSSAEGGMNLPTFALTREEARIILFLRMNKECLPFLEGYVAAEAGKRRQMEETWRLIHEFQP